jgi:glutamate-ammonia-ligase adenylyltransferase
LSLVAEIMAEAPLLAESLAERPALLDAVLTAEFSAPIPDRAALATDLAALLARARDFEERLDLLRRWANEKRFQVGVQLLRQTVDGTRAGEILADIAETAIVALLPVVMADLARLHGEMPGGTFAVLALGRLGSREMTLASDLDLILIYEAPEDSPGSTGPRPLAPLTYYARLSQRLISAIIAPTAEGRLYEVDMRLRPSGDSGPIATSLTAFAHYQREEAWTWEHMALTRARPIAGDPGLCERAANAIDAALRRPRDPRRLLVDVADMRRRIAESRPRPSPWDLRNRSGGLIDLEFIAQYLMLREAALAPRVLQREAGAALAALEDAGALPPRAVHELTDALNLLRHLRSLLALLFDGPPEPDALAGPEGATLARCAGAVDFGRLDADMTAACARVRFWYEKLVTRPARRAAQSLENTEGEMAR